MSIFFREVQWLNHRMIIHNIYNLIVNIHTMILNKLNMFMFWYDYMHFIIYLLNFNMLFLNCIPFINFHIWIHDDVETLNLREILDKLLLLMIINLCFMRKYLMYFYELLFKPAHAWGMPYSKSIYVTVSCCRTSMISA